MCKKEHDSSSANVFDDDFPEASIDAISIPALHSKTHSRPSSQQHSTSPVFSKHLTVDNDPPTSNSTLRRLLSSLLPLWPESPQPRTMPSLRVKSSISSIPTVQSSASASALHSSTNGTFSSLSTTPSSLTPHTPSTPTATNPINSPHSESNLNLAQQKQQQQEQPASLPLPYARVNLVHPHSFHLWHLHVFSLPHNAIRAELIDLCAMLHALTSTHSPPLHLLQEWFTLFQSFLSDYLHLENTILLPWAYAGVDDQRLIDFRNAMAPDRNLIAHLIDEVANALRLTTSRPIANTIPLLVRAVRDLVNPVLVYIEREERVLPNLIQAKHTRADALNVERVIAKQMDIGLLLRWVPSRSHRMKLRMKFLSMPDLFTVFCQNRLKTARHLAIVRTIVGPPQTSH